MFYSIISGANEGGNFQKTKVKTKRTRGEFRNEQLKKETKNQSSYC